MADLIDREEVRKTLYMYIPGFRWETIDMLVDNIPSAPQEIIRCGECKHWDTTWQNDYAPNYHYCPMIDGVRKDDFYCADAERRDENG